MLAASFSSKCWPQNITKMREEKLSGKVTNYFHRKSSFQEPGVNLRCGLQKETRWQCLLRRPVLSHHWNQVDSPIEDSPLGSTIERFVALLSFLPALLSVFEEKLPY